jgi:hypothetical protein
MKDRSSVFRKAIAAITAAAVCLGVPWSASAQNASTPNASATTVNPNGYVPGSAAIAPGTTTFTPPSGGAPTTQNLTLAYGVGEVVKMYQGGINKDVIVNYINNTALAYHLSADGIIYLQGLGMPQEITKAMILRDGQLQQQQQQAMQQFYQQQPVPPPGAMPNGYGYGEGQPPPQVATPSTPPPDVTVVGSDYPVYDAGYPYYGYYGYPYYWPGYIGGWGWGRGFGGFRGGFGGFHGGFGGGGFHGGFGGGGFHGAVGGGGFHGGGGGHGGGGHR